MFGRNKRRRDFSLPDDTEKDRLADLFGVDRNFVDMMADIVGDDPDMLYIAMDDVIFDDDDGDF